ncbi:hypothetical protein A3G67_03780 [Candidatus Roizmanbacteria bacterium RIFCSPLOWO2_12_FULL_40_12]|uniref:LysM domain-containing protein n=1 Tax=Candidatus Roizmanbacteria bacterium RIFCSPLOWO2_01_FULL_40_42 TaxID=1802066 RepID=A0A1F7J5P5_9BACT|nr:MAG: hypothetical protein A2779_03415 [Candidatus Roizmanbacteria bacterium RIFCSPHIGHO2_01_FULL_40_98]OGK28384.1 MAG: hypothetical protein A3C31_00780 [Candidatus Roizmanbacteria bacterium RIFCSPHIGHO2_02_FULL_40_53]OGK30620.1 MAG: hypothetical protein A2W49_03465 [Candidatus Roizmanbacteria bacterium RIFCSPHIGHO2_12_41_18]OGK37034.1 MAG: hypothetical protein A3E69_01040 [Candidatus Roizmanbacteria bacterium RIFCSPHIGHO2_12_FULL_40_130]OGK50940.1 MAG: hypothetical protein A3B50_01550 [Candi
MIETLQLYSSVALFYIAQYLDRYSLLLPLGAIGIWRWSVWVMKELVGSNYKPKKEQYDATVSLVVPVYNENPEVFKHALQTWKKNKPIEIIAVIDYTDRTCIKIFKEFQNEFENAVLIITKKPGKRPALVDGMGKAKGEVIALVDSDTIWDDKVIRYGLSPFHDPKVGGVATYQSVWKPKTLAQKIFDIQLDLRYMHDYPFLAVAGDALTCLSGRTAFYRKTAVLPELDGLLNETFRGVPVISGDDKCLTYLILKHGWKTIYQSNSHVYTPGMTSMGQYMKQRLRWTRNALRADSKAMADGWPRKHRGLFFFQVDKILQSFVIILSLMFFIVALILQQYLVASVIFIWWFLSRALKLYSHFMQKPKNLLILPAYVLYSFITGALKIYALLTLNTQGWITRWDKSRLHKSRFVGRAFASFVTVFIMIGLGAAVYFYKQYTYFIPYAKKEIFLSQVLPKYDNSIIAQNPVLGTSTGGMKNLFVKNYKVEKTESLSSIASKFGIDQRQLYAANTAKLPDTSTAPIGLTLSIPSKEMTLDPVKNSDYSTSPGALNLRVERDEKTNTIIIFGRGKLITFSELSKKVGDQYLKQIKPGVWRLSANLYLHNGPTLVLDKRELSWLQLESNEKNFVSIRTQNGDLRMQDVKITSWNSAKNDYDKNLLDGRSFIMVKDNSRMDIYNSELAYLGYPTNPSLAVSPYGVSWKLSGQKLKSVMLSGEVIGSKFHHNYFGAYTYGATGMLWKNNEFYANTRYGLDPHDDSNGFLITENYSHNNGTHGIILSKRCMYNVIENNISINNGLHGIMLHEKSDYNVVTNNKVGGNVSGIAIWRSSNNKVNSNTVTDNKHGVRANDKSSNNFFEKNTVSGSKSYGFYLYDRAENNVARANMVKNNQVGLYIKSDSNKIVDNRIIDNNIAIYFLESASKNIVSNNTIEDSSVYAVYTKIQSGLTNVLGANTFERNRRDTDGQKLN